MLLAWVLERSHSEVENVSSHFPGLGHWVEAAEFNRLNALHVLKFVQIALVDGAADQVSDITEDLLSISSLLLFYEGDDFISLMRLYHLHELSVVPLHPLVLFEEFLRWLCSLFLFCAILLLILACLALASASRLSLVGTITLCDERQHRWLLQDINQSLDVGPGTPLIIFFYVAKFNDKQLHRNHSKLTYLVS